MEQRTRDLLVVGDLNPDLVLRGDVVPRFGQAEQLLTAADVVLAGSGGIVAAGAARLGLRTAIAAHVGTDTFGDFVLAALAERGVDTSLVTRSTSAPTGLTVVLSTPADRAILTHPGAIELQSGDDVPDAVLASARHVHVAGYFLLPSLMATAADLFRRARAAGCTTSLDTNWDPDETWTGVRDVLPFTDVFLPNEAELLAVTGAGHLDDAAAAVAALAPGATLVVKAGARGATAWPPAADGEGLQARIDVPGIAVDVVDTTGAGDSFDAGFLAAWLTDVPLAQAVRRACVAGALSTRAAGGTAAQADALDVEAAL